MTRPSQRAALAVAALAAACAHDTSLPPPPGPGTIQGRVVHAVAGQSEPLPSAGARVTILGTSLGSTADAGGRFVVEGVIQSAGHLLIQADLDGDGAPDRQRLLDLGELKAGPGKDLALGDVAVLENGSMRGQVRLAGRPGSAGHAATVVFVPQGPFLTTTADDGSWLLPDLPPGPLSISYFHEGYEPGGVAGIELRAGERFVVESATLRVAQAPPGAPGRLEGTLSFDPALAPVVGATLTATDLAGAARDVPVAPSGGFAAELPAGLYQVEAARSGYSTAVIANVMVSAGQVTTLAIRLATGLTVTPPPPPPPPPTCLSGAACAVPNPCQVGAVSCATGSPVCVSTGSALDGTACGTSAVCQAGQCVPICIAGASCRPANPCESGVVACGPGGPACASTGLALADGSPCGTDQVCRAGACVACRAGAACPSPGGCLAAVTSCASGLERCVETATPLADGTSCGAGRACQAGVCGPCDAGAPCLPPAAPCHAGTVSCASGRPVCADLGTAVADGSGCGAGLVCGGGICAPCAAGAACTPSNPCHRGEVGCATGHPVCLDTLANAPPGTGCGAGLVCSGAGVCTACAEGSGCTPPADPCHAGAVACSSGGPVCSATSTPMAPGSGCGAGRVCDGAGGCVACLAGAGCAPANPCHRGQLSCATGGPVCQDTQVALPDGASCGPDLVCGGGSCRACAVGSPCDGAAGHATPPGSVSACKRYGTGCASGTPLCGELGDQPDDTPCPDGAGGMGNVCRAGSCTAPGSALRVATGGLGAQTPPGGAPLAPGHGWPGGSFTVTIQVVDVLGHPVTSGPVVTGAAPPGARVAPASAPASAADGSAVFTVTLGRAVGPQRFTFTTTSAFAPLVVTLVADAPPGGVILPVVNAARSTSGPTASGPASALSLSGPTGLAVSGAGELYVASTNGQRVVRVLPSGEVELVAGTGSAGWQGDGGLATQAQLYYPTGIALDEVSVPHRLIIADQYTHHLRTVDLSSGVITSLAGTGSSGFSGDGGPASAAQLSYPRAITVGPERPAPALYVADANNNRIRRIDGQSGVITTWLAPGPSCQGELVLSGLGAGSSGAGAMVFDSRGNAFVSGTFCGGDLGPNPAAAVVRRAPDGKLTRVAGAYGAGLAGGVSARNAGFAAPPALALDRAVLPDGTAREDLYLAIPGTSHALARVDGATLRLELLAGSPGTAATLASAGDFGPAASALLDAPLELAFAPGGSDLYVVEHGGQSVRLLAGAGRAAASTGSLAAQGPAVQAVHPLQQPPLPIAARLADGAGAPLSGYPVEFAADPAGLAGGWLWPAVSTTQAQGVAAVASRPGLALGRHGVLASYLDLHGQHLAGSPVSFSLDVAAPPAGTVLTPVNDLRAGAGFSGVPGPGWAAQIQDPRGLAVGPGGTVWFSDRYRLYRLDSTSLLSLAGGTGYWVASGDGGPATAAGMFPGWLAHDGALGPAGTLLFVEESASFHAIRGVDLRTGIVSTRWVPPGNASAVYLGRPLAEGGVVLVGATDNGNDPDAIHQLDLAAGDQRVFLATGASATYPAGPYPSSLATCPSAGPAVFVGCGGTSTSLRCSLARSPSGTLYVAGLLCGGGSNGATGGVPGLLRVEFDGSLTRVAGMAGAGMGTGALAGQVGLPAIPAIAFDAAGNLWLAFGGSQPLGSIDAPALSTSAFRLRSLSGLAVPPGLLLPLGTDPATSAPFSSPTDIGFDEAGHLWVTDPSVGSAASNSVRLVW